MMFRKPSDISSDSSSSSSSTSASEVREKNNRAAAYDSDNVIEFAATDTLSLSVNDNVSQDPPGNPADTSYNSHMIMATLVEELARTRAAEFLNTGTPGVKYSRVSPDVQPLAEKMFTQASKVLAANGVMPLEFASDDLQPLRRQYLARLDKIGLQALQNSDIAAAAPTQLRLENNELTIARPMVARSNDPSAFVGMPMASRSMTPQPIVSFTSPCNDMHLLTATNLAPRSRLRSDFQEIRVLGKGGFGRVYHVVNLLDNQNYAVKRIPLSPKVSKQWHETGLEESDNVLREIRTIARLEHCNVVRYYNAWIEAPSLTSAIVHKREVNLTAPARKLLSDRPALAPNANVSSSSLLPPAEDSGEEIFEEQSYPQQKLSSSPTKGNKDTIDGDSTWTSFLRDSEIFTDGRSHASPPMHSSKEYDSVYVLHLQMSIHPMTLTTYLTPTATDAPQLSQSATKRHCFHITPSLRLLLAILCGLQYLHAMHIVHRDIKPGNILLSECSDIAAPSAGYCDASCSSCKSRTEYWLNPRIADFGLVADLRRSSLLSSLTRSKVVGTEFYRPPFSKSGNSRLSANTDGSLDVFALGIVLFEMLWPFSTKMERFLLLTDLSQYGRLPDGFLAKLNTEKPGVGDMVAACILGMVERDSSRRWTCDQVQQCVEEALLRCQQHSPPEARTRQISYSSAA